MFVNLDAYLARHARKNAERDTEAPTLSSCETRLESGQSGSIPKYLGTHGKDTEYRSRDLKHSHPTPPKVPHGNLGSGPSVGARTVFPYHYF